MYKKAYPVKWLISAKQAAKIQSSVGLLAQPGLTSAPETAPLEPAVRECQSGQSANETLFDQIFFSAIKF